jgi:hypothetical protein
MLRRRGTLNASHLFRLISSRNYSSISSTVTTEATWPDFIDFIGLTRLGLQFLSWTISNSWSFHSHNIWQSSFSFQREWFSSQKTSSGWSWCKNWPYQTNNLSNRLGRSQRFCLLVTQKCYGIYINPLASNRSICIRFRICLWTGCAKNERNMQRWRYPSYVLPNEMTGVTSWLTIQGIQ